MNTLARSVLAMTRAKSGGVSVEQGLIAALIGVVIVSVVTTLSGTLEAPPTGAAAAPTENAR